MITFSGATFEDFSPIANAIRDNERLCSLKLYYSYLTMDLMEYVAWLVDEDALEALSVTAAGRLALHVFLDIAGHLGKSQTLKELCLEIDGDEGEEFEIANFSCLWEDVAAMLEGNQNVEKLSFMLPSDIVAPDMFSILAM